MSRTEHIHIFEAYGIEMEYMIVDRETLAVRPISDDLLLDAAKLPGASFETPADGMAPGEIELGDMGWSNELVMHVVELKTNGPTPRLDDLGHKFQREVTRVNKLLEPRGAMLMPTAMHPFFDPDRETKLWIHDNAEIYAAYNRIFGCKGHGWSNLQSVHINLPFFDDAEFGKLHAAVRLVLPILPALAASSPIFGGKASGLMDNRLEFYRHNQRAVPEITGGVIPEQAFTKAEYDEKIWQRVYKAIAPHDPDVILREEWLNSRGAIARFQRHAIEIRVLDIQESPRADAAVVAVVVSLVRAIADGRWIDLAAQKMWAPEPLRLIFEACVKGGDDAIVSDPSYLAALGVKEKSLRAGDLWKHLVEELIKIPAYEVSQRAADARALVKRGCLAKRILGATGLSPGAAQIKDVYRRLCAVLASGSLFEG